MSTLKKISTVGLGVATTVWLSGLLLLAPVPAHGQTVAELQAQIQQLLQLIANLQSQLSGLQGGGGAPGVACAFTRDLTVGVSAGDDVLCLQRYLNSAGFRVAASGAGSPGNETRFFGPLTQAAVGKWQAANGVSPAAGYFGSISRARYNALAGGGVPGGTTPPPTGVFIPASGIGVSLAVDNPIGKAVPFGANNVAFLKFHLAGTGTVTTLEFMRVGPGQTSDFTSSGAYLLDEQGSRLTNGRTVNSSTHKVTFTGLNVELSSSVKTLTLVAAMRTSSAGAGNRNAFELTSASAVTATAAVSGAFPVRGNEFTLTSAGVGGVTISSSTDPTNPKVGEKGAKVATFKIENTSSTDDLRIESVTLRYAGAVSRANLTNFVMKHAGNTVGSGGAINAKDLLTLKFSPSFLLERGQNKIFEVFADISPSVRAGSNETIIWYLEDTNDLVAVSTLYGYGAIPTNSYGGSSTAGQHMTIDGGQLTITFNGPTARDIANNAQDVTLADLTFTGANNLEIKNLRFDITTTGMGGATNEKFSDFKVVDTATGAVVAGPYGSDITTTTNDIALNDTWVIGAGQSRRLKVTADVGSASGLNNDTIRVTLDSFTSTDVKNVDNNTDVSTSDIVPNSTAGNTMTVKTPDLVVTLAGSPSSRTLTAGSQNVDLVGLNMRAVADDIQLRTMIVRASGASLSATDLTNALGTVRIMVDGQQIGQSKSLTGSTLPLSATFDNLNYTIAEGQTKSIKIQSVQVSNTASSTTYVVGLNDFSADIVAVDTEGNTLTLSGSANPTNGTGSVVLTIGTPSMTIARIGGGSDDTDAGYAVTGAAGSTKVLTRLEFIAVSGDVNVKKLQFGVANANTNATATGLADEVLGIYLKECSDFSCTGTKTTIIGGTDGLPIDATGNDASTVRAESTTGFFTVPRGQSKWFTIEARLAGVSVNSSEAADSGTDLYASLRLSNFEAVSGNTTLTTYTTSTGGTSLGITGNQKIVFRAKPTLAITSPGQALVTGTNVPIAHITVGAEGGPVGLKAFGVNISAAGATVTAPTTSNVSLVDITGGGSTSITVGSVSGAAITGGNNGDLFLVLTTPEVISPGSPKTYRLRVQTSDVSTTAGAASLSTVLDRNESAVVNSVATNNANLLSANGNYGANSLKVWVWSDLSDSTAATETDTQWANASLLRPFPVDTALIKN